jgi:hypothetical protein
MTPLISIRTGRKRSDSRPTGFVVALSLLPALNRARLDESIQETVWRMQSLLMLDNPDGRLAKNITELPQGNNVEYLVRRWPEARQKTVYWMPSRGGRGRRGGGRFRRIRAP